MAKSQNKYSAVRLLEQKLVIFDIDGCISDDEWRLNLIKPDGSDRFSEYHALARDDAALMAGDITLKKHIASRHCVVFITARPNSIRKLTNDWIRLKFPNCNFVLFMREEDQEGIGSVDLKKGILSNVLESKQPGQEIIAAYDDRPDVVLMYLQFGIQASILDKDGLSEYDPNSHQDFQASYERNAFIPSGLTDLDSRTAADILTEAGATFRERNAVYKDSWRIVGAVMAALFPNGVQLLTAADHEMYHLFELTIVKLTRFANSGLTHQDSIHDMAIYAAMCEVLVAKHNIQFNGNQNGK